MRKLKCLPPCEQDIFEIPEGVSYYEQLCNFVYYLNDLIDSSEVYNQEVENLQNTTIVSPQGTMDVNKVTAENGVITFEIDISNKGEPYALTSTILYFNTDASRPITTDYQTAISVEDKTFYITTTQTRVINGTPTDDKNKKEVVTFSNSFDIYGNQVSISEGGITRHLIADGAINGQKIGDASIVGNKIANNTIANNNMVEKTLEVGSVSDDFINKLSYRPNLLINGDFQVNQRSKTSYQSDGNSNQLTVDMWGLSDIAEMSLTSNDGYVTFTNNNASGLKGSFYQKYEDFDTSKQYTLVIKLKDEEAYVINREANQDINQGIKTGVYARINQTTTLIGVTINEGVSIDIEYIDLFEGSIAYPHVKEDYATALMRCKRYLLVGNYPVIISYMYSGQMRMIGRMYFDKMAGTPQIMNDVELAAYDTDGSPQTTKNYTSKDVYDGVVIFNATFGKQLTTNSNGWVTIQLSCEPK